MCTFKMSKIRRPDACIEVYVPLEAEAMPEPTEYCIYHAYTIMVTPEMIGLVGPTTSS